MWKFMLQCSVGILCVTLCCLLQWDIHDYVDSLYVQCSRLGDVMELLCFPCQLIRQEWDISHFVD